MGGHEGEKFCIITRLQTRVGIGIFADVGADETVVDVECGRPCVTILAPRIGDEDAARKIEGAGVHAGEVDDPAPGGMGDSPDIVVGGLCRFGQVKDLVLIERQAGME